MTMEAGVLVDGLCFGEGPRWHNDALWLSDMHACVVLRIDSQGNRQEVTTVAAWPSGLGWLPSGDLLIVSMRDKSLLRFDGKQNHLHADLSELASHYCNDMVVDAQGRAYVGNFGFDLHQRQAVAPAELICVEADGAARVVAEDLLFPNGTVITPDGKTLIVGESFGSRLTAFTIDRQGDLSQRREWAPMPERAVPDGICLDAAGGIWVASPSTNECLRIIEGGEVSHRVALDRGAFACMLGEQTLYILASGSSDPDTCRSERSGQVLTVTAPYPGAGWP